ncbi:uncharacterized protein BYT42DRAFT_561010 [Radiomyces spectabilis]|uniref:uncharacterized protein n=1 Tax=Radiomyces spectabilis TaxID=64574 RepID=UPI00221E7E51|nr:uncharacterized protein BYT42DRAFT_561010 [Radiomyces spectabilis]KAI8388724.1 hypothetical protein BYT42DRAFT_561010 [Radiomyces spectabilis]
MVDTTFPDSAGIKRSRKPKPLFNIFRKNKQQNVPLHIDPLGSGVTIPLESTLVASAPSAHHASRIMPPLEIHTKIENGSNSQPTKVRRRHRSKSVDPSICKEIPNPNSLTAREESFNKLCGRAPTTSLSAEDSILLSPVRAFHRPPVPPIPSQYHHHNSPDGSSPVFPESNGSIGNSYQGIRNLRKFSSAHDLRKAAKLEQENIHATARHMPMPMPKTDLSRSRSVNVPKHIHPSRSQTRSPAPPVPHHRMEYSPVSQSANVKGRSRSKSFGVSRDATSFRHNVSPPLPTQNIYPHNNIDDDDVPLAAAVMIPSDIQMTSPKRTPLHLVQPSSLLIDEQEEDDKDLVPIAMLKTADPSKQIQTAVDEYLTAADKYKEKVKERLHLTSENGTENNIDDDDIPISSLPFIRQMTGFDCEETCLKQ